MATGTEASNDAAGDPGEALGFGIRLQRFGDREGARRAFEEAAESEHSEHGPDAAAHLGALLADEGDLGGAEAAYQRAFDSGHADHAPRAAVQLGILLVGQQRHAQAQAAFESALSSGHPDSAPAAALHLGRLLDDSGDTAAAARAFELAVDSGHSYQAPPAAILLGQLRQGLGDQEGAAQAYRLAMAFGHPTETPRAGLLLGGLLRDDGDGDGARQAFQDVVDSGHPDFAAEATSQLRELAEPEPEPDPVPEPVPVIEEMAHPQAPDQEAADSGHPEQDDPEFSARAAFELGNILAGTGDREGAEVAYRVAVDSHHPKYAKSAAMELSKLTGEDVLAVVDGPDGLTRMLVTTIDEFPGPLVPVLVPADWNPSCPDGATVGTENYRFRPLLVAGHHVATVTFARLNSPLPLSLEPARPDMDVTQIETAAVGSLRTAGLRWTPFTFGDDDDGTIDMNGVLECTPHEVAASGVLDERLLLDAHKQLGSTRLVVAFPTQDSLVAAPADFPADRLLTLARLVAIWFLMSEEPVAHQMFYATNGVLSGIYEGSDRALAEMQDELNDAASADAESAGLPDDSPWIDDGSRGPLLPLLKPLDWEHTIEHLSADGVVILALLARPLVLADRHVGFVAFGRETAPAESHQGMVYEQAGEGADLDQIEAEAMDNLRATELRWRRVDVVIPAIDDRAVAGWTYQDNEFAGAAVLDPELLREAHRKAGSHRLLVALPSREALLVAVNDDDPQTIALFARAAALWYVNGDMPITHLTFLATDGVVDGVYEGSDRALREVEEFPVPARIMLATLGEPGEPPHPEGKLAESGWARVQELIDHGDPEITATVIEMAETFRADGDLASAARAFDMVVQAGHPDSAPTAALALGELLEEQDDPEAARAAYERAMNFAESEASQEAALRILGDVQDEGPLLPVLQPLEWTDLKGVSEAEIARKVASMARPLLLAGRHVGWVAFGHDTELMVELEDFGTDAGRAQVEPAALANLGSVGLEWKPLDLGPDSITPKDLLVCAGHDLAASGVLDPAFLCQAQRILGAARLVVAIPVRDILVAGRADLPAEELAQFTCVAATLCSTGDYPVTPLTFYATDGVVDGICE